MSDYKPGTVAMVTVTRSGQRCKAMCGGRLADDPWLVAREGAAATYAGRELSDITPLVCIEATREDAKILHGVARWLDGGNHASKPGPAECLPVLFRIRDAIREQTPAPLVIPENLGAVVEDAEGKRYVFCDDYANHPCDGKGHWMNGKAGIVERKAMRLLAVRVLSEGVTP